MGKIRVLHHMHALEIGGVTDLALDLIKYSDRDRFQFSLAYHTVNDECMHDEFESLGVTFYDKVGESYPALTPILREARADIVHVQPGGNAVDPAALAAINCKIPVIATIGTLGTIHHQLLSPSMTVVAGSKELYRRQSRGARFIYHGVDLDRLKCEDKREAKIKWGLDLNKPVVGWIGRFVAFKSPLTFVSTVAYTQEINPNIQFVMFGTHQQGIDLATSLADEIGANIHFLGGIRDKGLAYGCMDIACFPTFGEAFGRVPAEMLGAGLPMICSACSTNIEIAGPHALYLAPPNFWKDDWEDEKEGRTENYGKMWAWTILALLENEPLRRSMSENGQTRVRNLFDARVMAKKYTDLYQELYDGRNKTAPRMR